MKNNTIRQQLLNENWELIGKCNSKYAEVIKIQKEITEKMFKLIKRAFDKKMFPEEAYSEWIIASNQISTMYDVPSYYESLNLQQILLMCIFEPYVSDIKNTEFKKDWSKLIYAVEKVKNDYQEFVRDIRKDHQAEVEFNALGKVNILPSPPVQVGDTIHDMEKININSQDIISILQTKYLYVNLKIDLTYPKKTILTAVDEIIDEYQYPKFYNKSISASSMKKFKKPDLRQFIEKKFLEHYIHGGTVKDALDKVFESLTEIGADIKDVDSIRRRYLRDLRKKYGVRRTSDLRKLKWDK
jgi:hypothetical protein